MAESYPRIAQVVLDTTDARMLAEFYRQLFGLEYRAGDEPPAPNRPDPRGSDWLVLRNTHGGPQLAFQQTDGVRPSTWPDAGVPQMLHLDTVVATRDDLQIHRDRALALGATELLDRTDAKMSPCMCSPTLPDTHSAFSWDDPRIPWPRPAGEADVSKACFVAA